MQCALVLTVVATNSRLKAGCLLELTAVKVEECQEAARFEALCKWAAVVGDPDELAKCVRNGVIAEASEDGCDPESVGGMFAAWLHNHFGHQSEPITLVMTDAARDLPFVLEDLKLNGVAFHHRAVSVGTLFLRPDDFEVPGLQECCRRAKIDYKHTGRSGPAADAVVKLLQHWGVGHGEA